MLLKLFSDLVSCRIRFRDKGVKWLDRLSPSFDSSYLHIVRDRHDNLNWYTLKTALIRPCDNLSQSTESRLNFTEKLLSNPLKKHPQKLRLTASLLNR